MFEKACQLLDVEKNPGIIVDLLNGYMAEGILVSIKMFKLILNLCRAAKDADLSLWVLRKMKEFNCRPDTVCYNVVIRLFVEKGKLDEAMELMKEMSLIALFPDNVSYVLILKGLCDGGRLEAAFDLVKVMKGHGCVPNVVVYSTLLDGVCNSGNMESAFEFLANMEKDGDCKPNVVTYTTIVKSLADKGRVMEALKFLNHMIEYKTNPNRVTLVALLDGLCREGNMEEAWKLIDRFSGNGFHRDELFSILLMSLMKAGKDSDSEKLLRMMISKGMNPSSLASGRIITKMVFNGRVLDGFLLFDALDKSGNMVDSQTCSALLAALRRENRAAEAVKVINIMSNLCSCET